MVIAEGPDDGSVRFFCRRGLCPPTGSDLSPDRIRPVPPIGIGRDRRTEPPPTTDRVSCRRGLRPSTGCDLPPIGSDPTGIGRGRETEPPPTTGRIGSPL